MASDDTPTDGPSIAPPTLGFGLRRRKKDVEPPADVAPVVEPAAEPTAPPVVEPDAAPVPEPTAEPVAAPVVEPTVEPAPANRPSIFGAPAVSTPVAPPAPPPAPAPVVVPPTPEPSVVPEPAAEPEPVVVVPPQPVVVAAPEPDPVVVAKPEPVAQPAFQDTSIIPGMRDEPTAAVPVTAAHLDDDPAAGGPTTTSTAPTAATAATADEKGRRRLGVSAPAWFEGRTAAMATGALVGLAVVGATALVLRLCTLVRGTSTCGGAPGFLLLMAILVGAVLLGSRLLRLGHVADSGSTSALAVGLLAVVTLVFLLGSIYAWWMVVVLPLLCLGAYALSWWISTALVDND